MDAVAGGGGIITLPAYMFAGVPIHMAYGTNKFGNSFGTAIATFNYGRGGFIRWRPGFVCAAMSLIGSWLGSAAGGRSVRPDIAVLYNDPVACCRCFYDSKPEYRKRRKEEQTGQSLYVRSALIGLIIGGYDGFLAPAPVLFMVMALTSFLGYSLICASGNAKLVNLASNIGSLIAYIYHGDVLFLLGIPAAICSILGNFIGTKIAIKIGGNLSVRFCLPQWGF